jgi:hypothetical protein
MKKNKDYKKAYNIFMDYWDSLSDNLSEEDKKDIDKKLKDCGL